MQTDDLTSVIVVAADSGPALHECIERLLASSAAVEVTLIDNASSDGMVSMVAERFAVDERLRVIRNKKNIGFGPACNTVAADLHGDVLVILNPDCYVAPDTISALRDLLHDNPGAGLIGVNVCQPDGTPERANRRRDPTLWRALMTLTGLARWESRFPRLAGIVLPSLTQTERLEEVEAVSGACLSLRRSVFDQVGGFDSGYFLHCEDLDLCRRVRAAGRKVLFAKELRAVHVQGSSSRHRPVFVSWHKHRSMWRYFRKFDNAAKNPALSALVWCGIWAHFVALLPMHGWRKFRSRV